jgi:hypothetical protein
MLWPNPETSNDFNGYNIDREYLKQYGNIKEYDYLAVITIYQTYMYDFYKNEMNKIISNEECYPVYIQQKMIIELLEFVFRIKSFYDKDEKINLIKMIPQELLVNKMNIFLVFTDTGYFNTVLKNRQFYLELTECIKSGYYKFGLDIINLFELFPYDFVDEELTIKYINCNTNVFLKTYDSISDSNFTENVALEILKVNPDYFSHMRNIGKTYKVCMEAVKLNSNNLRHVPKKIRGIEICRIVYDVNKECPHIPKKIRFLIEKIRAVKNETNYSSFSRHDER